MTNEEKSRISEYREQGFGYKKIGKLLGLSESTVKSYCKRIFSVPEDNTDKTSCECCGAPVTQIPGKKYKRFCSDGCRIKWWNRHRESLNHKKYCAATCTHCGKVFIAYGAKDRKYCCRKCYIAERFGK